MRQEENGKIEAVPPFEAENLPRLCEIRFDAFITMYEMGVRTIRTGLFGFVEKSLPPQWFKNQSKITLEAIKQCDEYTLGRRLKEMLFQLEEHIRKYENKTI